MALSPSHRFGQIIGDLLEAAIRQPLEGIANEFGLYLDYKRPRPARGGKKVLWTDFKGNSHDLDFVLEAGGSDSVRGRPKAFVETAWRRYTKHSRNKAQEMQGAILPLAETYGDCHPFLGAVLAGCFTNGSLTQLRSHGFHVLFYPYEAVIALFRLVGIDANWDEDTPDNELQAKVDSYNSLATAKKKRLVASFRQARSDELAHFLDQLRAVLSRTISEVLILPLHGKSWQAATVEDAISHLERYDESQPGRPFVRHELTVRYTNGNEVRGTFHDKAAAIEFLRKLT